DTGPRGRRGGRAAAPPRAGRPFDLDCQARYGLIGSPIAADEATDAPAEGPRLPEAARRQLFQGLGPGFLVFRGPVQQELGLSGAQKRELEERAQKTAQEALRLFQKVNELRPEEREKEFHSYREKAEKELAGFLKGALTAEQLRRLRQLELQQQGPFALLRPDVAEALQLSDEQKR